MNRYLDVDSTVRFDVAPAKSAHYISMAHRPCGAWVMSLVAVSCLWKISGCWLVGAASGCQLQLGILNVFRFPFTMIYN